MEPGSGYETTIAVADVSRISVKGVIQVRPGTISEGGGGGGGGGGGLLSASDPIRKVGALLLFGIGPTLLNTLLPVTILAEGVRSTLSGIRHYRLPSAILVTVNY